MRAATLVRIDPGLLGRNDPAVRWQDAVSDRGRRCEEEATMLEVPALVSA
jgi:hypothetical protein